jgi:hypothetical protein
VATNGPIVHPQGDNVSMKKMLEWYRQGKTPDLSTRALWQSYQHLSSNTAGGTGEGNYECHFTKYVISYVEGLFNVP